MGEYVDPEVIRSAGWAESDEYPGLHELRLGDTMLAWVQRRPSYCDRGHWQGVLECSPGNPLDSQDGGTHYYMRLSVAKREIEEKLLWRLCKIPPEPETKGNSDNE